MGLAQDNMFSTTTPVVEDSSFLNKRRRFVSDSLPMIQCIDNRDIEGHTFSSPLILQLCEQSPSQQEIETQLLQVGMRVRKSVSDGYKHSPSRHAFTPRPFFNRGRLSPETQAALSAPTPSDAAFMASGLPNSNGLAMQPLSTATYCGVNLAALSHISEDWSTPIDQQKLWSYSTSLKRNMEDDSDSDDSQEFQPRTPCLEADAVMGMPVDYFSMTMDNMSEVSSFTRTGETMSAQVSGRRVVMPKSRLRKTVMATESANPFAVMGTAQQQQQHQQQQVQSSWNGHRRMTSCGLEANMSANDFGEASFLQRREDMDMDCS